MPTVNEDLFKSPRHLPNHLNVSYKKRTIQERLGASEWKSYMVATGGGFNAGGIMGPIELHPGMELWKVTGNALNMGKGTVSEWWCAKNAYKEQTQGLCESVREAAFNGVPLHVYARIASCIKVEWNTIDNIQIIKLNYPATALWGKFAPMTVHDIAAKSNPQYWTPKHDAILEDMRVRGYDLDDPIGDAWLGGMDAYQLFIPGLLGEHVTKLYEAPSEQNELIAKYLGIVLPKAFEWRT